MVVRLAVCAGNRSTTNPLFSLQPGERRVSFQDRDILKGAHASVTVARASQLTQRGLPQFSSGPAAGIPLVHNSSLALSLPTQLPRKHRSA